MVFMTNLALGVFSFRLGQIFENCCNNFAKNKQEIGVSYICPFEFISHYNVVAWNIPTCQKCWHTLSQNHAEAIQDLHGS